jgi:hypothetical protein
MVFPPLYLLSGYFFLYLLADALPSHGHPQPRAYSRVSLLRTNLEWTYVFGQDAIYPRIGTPGLPIL